MAALTQEPRWSTQMEIAHQLLRRRDVFNVSPLCEFLVQSNRNREVQRAVAGCIAVHAPEEGARWLAGRVFNAAVKTGEKELALRALADMRVPHLSVPILMRACRGGVEPVVRRAAFFRLSRSGRCEAVRFLIRLARASDDAVAQEAAAAVDTMVALHGGPRSSIEHWLHGARDKARRGKRGQAGRMLCCALRLGRYCGLDSEALFRPPAAA
jgi:hypothetical protein